MINPREELKKRYRLTYDDWEYIRANGLTTMSYQEWVEAEFAKRRSKQENNKCPPDTNTTK